ncbi:type IV pilus assembly protein PilO [Undibacterium sp. GrIS 1.8]|uniref:type 4a pilus biogenesis protein PilO n=1 Tax=unclassified Undibacterium TaxID=2630295 RepID=UPI00339B6B5C
MANLNELTDSISSQFRDLNGLHPGLWPIIPRMLSAFSLLVVLVILGYYGYWSGQLEELDRGQQEENTLKDSYRQKMLQAISLDALKDQRKLVLQYVAAMEKQLPSKAEMDSLVSDINQAALGKGLQIDVFKPGQPAVKDYYAELPIDIKLLGNYHDMGEFASDIAKLPRIITLNNLAISTGKDNVLVLDVVAKTFRYLDPEEVSAQAALKKGAKK